MALGIALPSMGAIELAYVSRHPLGDASFPESADPVSSRLLRLNSTRGQPSETASINL